MALTIVDWLNDGTIPQSKTAGNWTPSQFNTGKFRQPMTFTNASTHASWRPASLTFWGVNTTNDTNGAAIWLEWNPAGGTHRLLVVALDGTTILGSATVTWAAGTTARYTVDQSSATAGASTLTTNGFLTGDGVSTGWTRSSIFAGASLHLGAWGGGGYQLPAGSVVFGDIDDANDSIERTVTFAISTGSVSNIDRQANRTTTFDAAAGAVSSINSRKERTATFDVVSGAVSSANAIKSRSAALAIAVGAISAISIGSATQIERTATFDIASGAVSSVNSQKNRTTTVDVAVGAVSSINAVTRNRTVSMEAAAGAVSSITAKKERTTTVDIAASATSSISIAGAATFGIGVTSSALSDYGHSLSTLNVPGGYLPGGGPADVDGRVPTAVNTQPTGSTIYGVFGRPSSVNTAVRDNKLNGSYTTLAENAFNAPWTAWESLAAVKIGALGGTNHILTIDSLAADEDTGIWTELTKCAYMEDFQTSYTLLGTSQISPAVQLSGPGYIIVDWLGDSASFGPENSDWTVTAVGEGLTWIVLDSRIKNHNNGWIPVKRWIQFFPSGVSGSASRLTIGSLSPNQGARWYAGSFQETRTIGRTVTFDIVASAQSALNAIKNRTATTDIAVGAVSSANARRERTATVGIAVGAVSSIAKIVPRSVTMDVAVGATSSINHAGQRSVNLSISAGAVSAIDATRNRSTTMDIAAGTVSSVSATKHRNSTYDVAVGTTSAIVAKKERTANLDGIFSCTSSIDVVAPGIVSRTAQLNIDVGVVSSIARIAERSIVLDIGAGAISDISAVKERRAAIDISVQVYSSITQLGQFGVGDVVEVRRMELANIYAERISRPYARNTMTPGNIPIRRKRGVTGPEIYRVIQPAIAIPQSIENATFVMNIEGLGSLPGVILSIPDKLVSFPFTNSLVYDAPVGTYDYEIVMTSGGTTDVLVESQLIMEERLVTS